MVDQIEGVVFVEYGDNFEIFVFEHKMEKRDYSHIGVVEVSHVKLFHGLAFPIELTHHQMQTSCTDINWKCLPRNQLTSRICGVL